jgi:putative spermidine/putrescine transport system permease protein
MTTMVAVGAIPGTATRAGAGDDRIAWLLLLPLCVVLLGLFIVPIAYLLSLSVTDPTVSLEHYERIIRTPLYGRVLLNTFLTAFIVTLLTLILGYPLAYVMARHNNWVAAVLLGCVAMCFWTGFVVRTYAWMVILGNKGPVAAAHAALGLDSPSLLFTSFASILGMTHILLPYMVLALYGVMRRIDTNLLRAAASLGANPRASFREVFLPLSLPGVVNGAVLVFTICLGFYVTPILLGSPRDMMISQLINLQIEELLAWGFASALAVVLLSTTAAILVIYNRFAGLDRLWG